MLKLRVLRLWPYEDLRIIDWLFLAVGIGVISVVMAIASALIYLLAALGVPGNLYGILVVGAGISAVLAIPAMVIVRRRQPPDAETLLEAEDDGDDELADDADSGDLRRERSRRGLRHLRRCRCRAGSSR